MTVLSSKSVVIYTRVNLDSTGQVTNSASVSGDEVDPYPESNVATSSANILSTLTVYEQDFEANDPYLEWYGCTTPITTKTPSGQNYLGEYANETACLQLPGLLDHSHVTVSFDLYIVRSWDGNEIHRPVNVAGYMPYSPEQIIGPDEWLFKANGKNLIHTTFANWDWQSYGFHQAYPDDYPWGSNPALSGAMEVNSLGYYFSTIPMDAIYHLTFTFRQGNPELTLDFSAVGLQGLTDESWGVDNLTVLLSHGVGIPPETVYLPVIFR
jgi:hypothetical protein